jgi:CubicO group peptidase (beta-lactamase class C family)/beta-glucosidase-like glycosyl hydrolase
MSSTKLDNYLLKLQMENAPMLKKVCRLVLFHVVLLTLNIPMLQAGIPGERVPRDKWIARAMDTLTTEEKIGQLFIQPVSGATHRHELRELEALIKKYNVGGLFFQGGEAEKQIQLIRQMQSVAPTPLLVALDARHGLGTSLQGLERFPSFSTLGAIQNEAYLYELGKEVALQCRALGVHINMSPVLQSSPGVQQLRSSPDVFSQDQSEAFSKGLRYMQGMQEHGLIPCYEQLPLNSQLAAARLEGLSPAIAPSLQGKLVAQLSFIPQGEDINDKSLLLRTAEQQDFLYEKYLKLQGLVLSEPLTQYQGDAGTLAVEALRAGNDILVSSSDLEAAVSGILEALAEGKLKLADIDRRVYKIMRAKHQVGLDTRTYLPEGPMEESMHRRAAQMLKQYLYEEAVTLVRNVDGLIPIRVLDTTSFASLSIHSKAAEVTSPFQQMLSRYAPFEHFSIKDDLQQSDYDQLFQRLGSHGHVIVALYEPLSREGRLSKKTISFLNFLQQKTHVTIIAFAHPHLLGDLDSFRSLVCAYEDEPMAQQIVPQMLFGAIGAKGRLPVNASASLLAGTGISTKPLARLGYSMPEAVGLHSDTLAIIDSLAQWAIDEEMTPGCQVLVARKGKIVFEKAYGYQTYDKEVPITPETIYDIASVTKVAATMQGVMFLQERGTIEIDEKISYYLPELKNTDKEHITIRELLLHRAGLRSFIPFWAMTKDKRGLNGDLYSDKPEGDFSLQVSRQLYGTESLRDSVWHWTVNSKLRRLRGRRNPSWKPDYNYRYSDLSFYMLHRLVEKMTNQPIDQFLKQNFYDPLGLTTMMYQPLQKFPAERIAPTEKDTHFRNELVRGTVHDEGAALYGGIAGHAGLFSNAHDLAVLMQMNLQDGIYGGDRYYLPGTISRFSIRQYNDSRRGLGWDKPEYLRDGGPTAPEASYASYGHLGFTGTSVWVDPKYDLVYVFLSNRVHPSARNTKLLTEGIRTKIQSVVYRAMNDYSGR